MKAAVSNPSRQIAAATLLLSASVLALHPDTPQIQDQQEVGAVKQRPQQQKTGRSHERLPLSAVRAPKVRVQASPVPSSPLNWSALAQCESSGNPRASYLGRYFGLYQFDVQTWASVGGTGNPADASPAEQTARAQQLYDERGAAPWPVCGYHLEDAA